MKDDTFLKIIKDADETYTEEIATTGFIDTGCYAFNAAVSGSIFGGVANNRITQLVGDPSTGKTYFAMTVVKTFLNDFPTGRVVYFDSEFAMDKEFFKSRGIDDTRVYVVQPETLEDFRTKILKILESIEKQKPSERAPMLFVLDSLGNLPSNKELADSLAGLTTRDMTKQQVIRSIFRTATQRLGKLNCPLIVCNHSYQVIGAYVPTKEASGGGGIKFAASSIIFLSKKKDKDGNDITGNLITVKMDKSRFTREHTKVELRLSYQSGLHRFYGLLPIAEAAGVFKKVATRWEMPDGLKIYEKELWKNPEKYFTQEILETIDAWCQKNIKLGSHAPNEDEFGFEGDTTAGLDLSGDITYTSETDDEE